MNVEALEEALANLSREPNRSEFIYELLLAYGQPRAAVTRLRKGDYNSAKQPSDVLWKKKLFFRYVSGRDLHLEIDACRAEELVVQHKPRFLIVTDFTTLLAVDTTTHDSIDIPLQELTRHYDFFLPWAGLEKSELKSENPADIRAAEKMGRLYDNILDLNQISNEEERHALNVFLARLLFCFFAEDTGIFEENQFTNAIASHTADDGSDLQPYLERLFRVLNTKDRSNCPRVLDAFPYVNGGLFAESIPVPVFDGRARKTIIESGTLNWKAINPDIFGSMIQAVVSPQDRSTLGLHYTSVVNILKVLDPLFLDEFRTQLEHAGESEKKLKGLLLRLYSTRVFDPACGCGNFLVIAYKELCKLEIEIFKRLNTDHLGALQTKFIFESELKTSQFFGIEVDDFAHEIAKVSLWLAEHQMNIAFKEVFGHTKPTLPLTDGGHIVCGNATRLAWESICPQDPDFEIFLVGNPPYKGSRVQSKEQKEDLKSSLAGLSSASSLDYVACWFALASEYIDETSRAAFVATSSIVQGSQVPILWPHIFEKGVSIDFAYRPFNWSNSAKGKAGVTCVIVGISTVNTRPKRLYSGRRYITTKNINAYLIEGESIFIQKERRPICDVPAMLAGNYTGHAQPLMLTNTEKEQLVHDYPSARRYLRRVVGSMEILRGISRWCLWISDDERNIAESIEPIQRRILKVYESRIASRDKSAQKLACRPHQFRDLHETKSQSIVVPTVSSERRAYLPVSFIDSATIVTNKAMVLYDPELYIFGLLSSRMHWVWVHAIAGRMREDISYSSVLCYNSFPFPNFTDASKELITEAVFAILESREKYPERTLASLYAPDQMPSELLACHRELDGIVERTFSQKPFENDQQRLAHLFARYRKLTKARESKANNA